MPMASWLPAERKREFRRIPDHSRGVRPVRNSVPAGAAEEIGRLNALIERAVLEAIDLVQDMKCDHGEPDAVALTRYHSEDAYAGSRAAREGLPHACHNALIGRTKVALERIGARVEIAWGD